MDAESIKIDESRSVHTHLWTRGGTAERGYVILVHGLGDHGGRYRGLAQRLVRRDFGVLAVDLPGHGRSSGRRGMAKSYRSLLNTISLARQYVIQRFGKTRQILLGHSMGGNLVINYALRSSEFDPPWMPDPDQLVLAAPMLMPPQVIDRARLVAAWATGHLFRWVRVSRDARLDQLTSDTEAAEIIQSDPLQHSRISLYLATQLLAQGRFALDHAKEVHTPTLVLIGESDELVDQAACQHLTLRMPMAEFLSWPDGRHDLFHDVDADAVVGRIIDWIEPPSVSIVHAKAA
ncbi:MAG: alpha/beta fold hydrolase [Planctomycetota bacterium]